MDSLNKRSEAHTKHWFYWIFMYLSVVEKLLAGIVVLAVPNIKGAKLELLKIRVNGSRSQRQIDPGHLVIVKGREIIGMGLLAGQLCIKKAYDR